MARSKRTPAAVPKRATKAKANTKAAKPARERVERPPKIRHARDEALEAAILEAPLDPLPRLVYGDWLQSQGDLRGDWVSLCAGVEATPTNVQLRAASVAFLEQHRDLLLGEGVALLPGMWIGWRGGFIDELRIQPLPAIKKPERIIAALLAHPSARFVRHLALGRLLVPAPALDAIVDARPALESLVVKDTPGTNGRTTELLLEPFGALRRLSLRYVTVKPPFPPLVELVCSGHDPILGQLAAGLCPTIEELTVDCERAPAPRLAAALAKLPALRRLRLLHVQDGAAILDAIEPTIPRLELLDISHSELGAAADQLLALPPNIQLVAIRTTMSLLTAERLQSRGTVTASTTSTPSHLHAWGETGEERHWLVHRLLAEGRDAVRLVPGAGYTLYNIGIRLFHAARYRDAQPLLEASVTLPSDEGTRTWVAASIVHERLYQFDDAELVGREGLLRAPKEPNFFAIVIDALRRSDRLDQALALVPRALEAVLPWSRNSNACLLDCMHTLAQAGRHGEVIALGREHAKRLEPDMRAVVAMSQLAIGKISDARATLTKLKQDKSKKRGAVQDHLAAVAALKLQRSANRIANALAALERAREARYPEWHWIGVDPNLGALAADPTFRAFPKRLDPPP